MIFSWLESAILKDAKARFQQECNALHPNAKSCVATTLINGVIEIEWACLDESHTRCCLPKYKNLTAHQALLAFIGEKE